MPKLRPDPPAVESAPARPEIPNKLFFKIGEVSRITGVEPYILRYWESEFSALRPRKNKSGQRVYVRSDVDLILRIKHMLYHERYTIAGAKKRLAERSDAKQRVATKSKENRDATLKKIREGLQEILALLDGSGQRLG